MTPFFPSLFFFFNATATTEIYTLSLHDALPISAPTGRERSARRRRARRRRHGQAGDGHPVKIARSRSEEHTSELQSPDHLVCRLLLEKKKKKKTTETINTKTTHSTQRSTITVRM